MKRSSLSRSWSRGHPADAWWATSAASRPRGIRATIPCQVNERRTGGFDQHVYQLRNRVERLINRSKQFRQVATTYEKLAANYQAMVTLAASLLWLLFANTPYGASVRKMASPTQAARTPGDPGNNGLPETARAPG